MVRLTNVPKPTAQSARAHTHTQAQSDTIHYDADLCHRLRLVLVAKSVFRICTEWKEINTFVNAKI